MDAFRKAVERVMDRTTDDQMQQLDCALMASVQKQLTEVADAVATILPLAELSDPEKLECAKTSSVKRYPIKSVIYDDDRDSSEGDAYFLLEGHCTCVQRLFVRKTTVFGRDRYSLIKNISTSDQLSSRDVQTIYVKMSDFRPGSVFGLGERHSGRLVIATSNVKFLQVPLTFLAKHNASNIWGRIVCSLNGSNPTVEQSFRKFLVNNKWEEYKNTLLNDIIQKHKPLI